MRLPILEIYSSMECPFAFLAIHRLRQVWPAYAGRIRLVWRALSLEYINSQGYAKPLYQAELDLLLQIDPTLPMRPWPHPDWHWPSTFWPVFEALACAQAQGDQPAFAMSWALRYAYFYQGRNPSLRHELLAIAGEVAAVEHLDLACFEDDWDSGRYKALIIAESRYGWRELKVNGSPTFVLPDGRQVANLAIGEYDLDEANGILHSYTPFAGDPLNGYRDMLDSVLKTDM